MAVIADVFEVILISEDGSIIGTTTLQDGNIETSVQENDVRAGRGNQLLGVLHSDRDITITLTDVGFRYDWLASQLGQDIKTGAGVAWAMPKWYEVEGEGEIELDEEPLTDNHGMKIFDENGEELDFTVSGKTVTLTGAIAGDRVEVRGYQYTTDPSTETIEIDNSVFAKGVQAVLETIEIDENSERTTHILQWKFFNSLPTGNFTISTASAREASTNEFTLRVVKPKHSSVVGESLRIPVSE